jgi:hypothetical protein
MLANFAFAVGLYKHRVANIMANKFGRTGEKC